MHIELIDLLRCPRDHDETWLVAAFTAIRDRIVEEGKLGCPICNAEYPIERGVVKFASEPADIPLGSGLIQLDTESAIRLAAFLNLSKPGSLAVFQGDRALLANLVSEMTESRVIGLDPAVRVSDTELTASVLSDSRIPLASGAVDAVALTDSRYLKDTARVLRQGGRLVARFDVTLPAGLAELARDDTYVVAEAHGPVISLRRS